MPVATGNAIPRIRAPNGVRVNSPRHGGSPMTEAGAVAAWPREAGDETGGNRIDPPHEDHSNRRHCLLGRER